MIDDLIRKYEGCRLVAYPDPSTGGKPYTCGWGSTKKEDGSNFKLGEEITQEKADALLTDYIQKNIVPIFNKIPYELTADQKESLASLIYNIGGPSFLSSRLYKAICEKNWYEVCKQWDWGYKNNLNGLFKRRTEECYLFIKDI